MLTLTSPVETWLHPIPAGFKLALLMIATVLVIRIGDIRLLAGILLCIAVVFRSFGSTFFRQGMRAMRPLWPFVLVVATWHAIIGDLTGGSVVILHLLIAVSVANLVTMTTALNDMMAVIERLTPTIGRIGFSPRTLSLAVALAIRFVPVFGQRIEQIAIAFRARSAKRPRWRILLPAILGALDDAEHVSDALKARGGANPNIRNTGF